MFEYKVRCRHKVGWKEIKLYADTDTEEFFNKNSIDYVRNMTDTVEHRQLKEIDRLINLNKQLVEECQRLDDEETRLNNKINNDLEEFNDKLNTCKWLENDFKEHSIHYYQLECLVEYLKQLKENK